MGHSDGAHMSRHSGHEVKEVSMQRDRLPGRQEGLNSPSDGMRFRPSWQSSPEHLGVSNRH